MTKYTLAQLNAFQRWHGIGAVHQVARNLYSIPQDVLEDAGVSLSDLVALSRKLQAGIKNTSVSARLCPACKKHITGRKFRSDLNRVYYGRCDACDTSTQLGRVKLDKPFKQWKAELPSKHPELFI